MRKAQNYKPAQFLLSPYEQSHQMISALALKLPLLTSGKLESVMTLLASPPP